MFESIRKNGSHESLYANSDYTGAT
jgi:hypothetical protein